MRIRSLTGFAALLLALPVPAAAQARVMLRGVLDGELWDTDTNSTFLARNQGRPATLGRLVLWGAVEPVRRLSVYGLLEVQDGTAAEEYEAQVEQAGVRVSLSRFLEADAGRITLPIGAFAARRFSHRNPLIGEPDGYPVQYPLGMTLSGRVRMFDYRAAVVDLPVAHDDYTPDPSSAWRPVLGIGVTPYVGVRLGVAYTWGPYLNDTLSESQLRQRSWRSYHQRVAMADLSVSFGYMELVAEVGQSSYDVPGRAEPIDGLTYYAEGRFTVSPRFFVATRVERNDYPFIRPVSPTFWVARKTDFRNEELGLGYRLTASTLVKASYRQDKWNVNGDNAAFIRPGGHAVALQISQQFDVLEWVDRMRLR